MRSVRGGVPASNGARPQPPNRTVKAANEKLCGCGGRSVLTVAVRWAVVRLRGWLSWLLIEASGCCVWTVLRGGWADVRCCS